jgi:hypothetical protein
MGLYNLALNRLLKTQRGRKIVPFPEVFQELCRSFSIKKDEAWELLFILRDFGFVELVRGHGIRINKQQINFKCE